MAILLEKHARGFAVRAERLDSAAFARYLNAVRAAGVVYEPMSRCHVGTALQLPGTMTELQKAKLPFALADGLAEHALAEATKSDGVSVEAAERARAAAARTGHSLWAFQAVGAAWLAGRKTALLGDEMGLGKTVQALCALPADTAAIVVAPAACERNWLREARLWRPELRTESLRKLRPPERGELLTITYGKLPDEANLPPTVLGFDLIGDEIHACKSGKAKRTARWRALARRARRVWALSGTPMLNRPDELWHVLLSAGCAVEAFGNWPSFVRSFGGTKGKWGGYTWRGPSAAVAPALRRVMLRRVRKEVLPDLPAKVRTSTEVEIDVATTKELDAIAAELLSRGIDLHSADLEVLSGPIAFALLSRARQLLAMAKIPAAEERVAAYEDDELPLLVFAAHLGPLHSLGKRDKWGLIVGDTAPADRARLVSEFQSGALRGLALSYAAGGVGITLTRAAHVLCVDLPWTPALLQQAEDRACRIGQTASSISVEILHSDHPIDARVAQLILEKTGLIESTVDAARTLEVPSRAQELQAALEKASASQVEVIAQDRAAKAIGNLVDNNAPRPPDEAERMAIDGLARVAAADADKAQEQNGVGFSRFDGEFGHSIVSQFFTKGKLTPKQWALVVRLANNYRKQLGVEK